MPRPTGPACANCSSPRLEQAAEGPATYGRHRGVAPRVVPDQAHSLLEGPRLPALPLQVVWAKVVAQRLPRPCSQKVPGTDQVEGGVSGPGWPGATGPGVRKGVRPDSSRAATASASSRRRTSARALVLEREPGDQAVVGPEQGVDRLLRPDWAEAAPPRPGTGPQPARERSRPARPTGRGASPRRRASSSPYRSAPLFARNR